MHASLACDGSETRSMNQFGMQMPGGKSRRGASPDVFTALLFLSCAALLAACVMVFMQGSKIGPDGSAFKIQEEGRISLPK